MSFKPQMPMLCAFYFGVSIPDRDTPFAQDIPCAFWLTHGRQGISTGVNAWPIIAQLAVNLADGGYPVGWKGWPPVWHPEVAPQCLVKNGSSFVGNVLLASGAPMWVGTPDEHFRFNCVQFPQGAYTANTNFQSGLVGGFAVTLQIYRPFGAAAPTGPAIAGVYYPDILSGRGGYSGGNYTTWSDLVEVPSSTDVRDGVSRAAGLDTISYADGDEVRIPAGANASRYVVTRVVNSVDAAGVYFKRVYLLRDQAHWPGPITTP